eukprot:Phypoly_transcript_02557.p1 GENE.Phypoly_transcript_02557~~Phypoly_transcript_02557.p1  ORF type:complete len:777 (+),score=74.20 Phypoly_transcript_02557:61-2391(+)
MNWTSFGTQDIESHFGDVAGPGSRTFAHTWVDSSGNFYLFGGIGFASQCTNRVIYGDVWKYSTTSQAWQNITQTSSFGPLAGGITWLSENLEDVYIYGGFSDLTTYNGTSKVFINPIASSGLMYVYHMIGNYWEISHQSIQLNYAQNEPGPRLGSVAWVQDGKMMLYGGMDTNGDVRRDMWIFDAETKWTYISGGDQVANQLSNSTMPGCVFGASGVMIFADLYILGGRDFQGADSPEVWRFNGTWLHLGNLEKGMSYAAAFTTTIDVITLVGGYTTQGPISDIVEYDINGPEISRVTNSTIDPRFGMPLWNNIFYGGTGNNNLIYSDMWLVTNGNDIEALTSMNWVQLPSQYTVGEIPSVRVNAMTWTDPTTGDMWMFGGQPGYTCINLNNGMNDMWRINQSLTRGIFYSRMPLLQAPPARIRAATWTDNLGRFWMFSGVPLNDPGTLLCDMWMFDPISPAWYPIGTCALSDGLARAQAITWQYNGILYLFGGIVNSTFLTNTYKFDTAHDRNWVPAANFGRPEPSFDLLAYVNWQTDEYMYMYGHGSRATWSWDLKNEIWANLTTNGDTPGYISNPIRWTSPSGQFYLCPDHQFGTVWAFTPKTNEWNQVASISLSAFGFVGSTVPYWESSFVFAYSVLSAYGGVGMFKLDLCLSNNGDCDIGDVCRHYPTLACIAAEDVVPVSDFQFSESLFSEDHGLSFTLNATTSQVNVNYISSDCGEAVNFTSQVAYTSSDPAQSVWRSAANDFSLGIRVAIDFADADFHTIIATKTAIP